MSQTTESPEPERPHPGRDDELARSSRAATVAAGLAHRARAGVFAYVLLGLVVTAFTSVRAELPLHVLGFAIGLLIIGAARLALAIAAPRLIASAPRRWTAIFRVAALTSAAYWGLAAGLMTARGLGADALVVLVATAGLAAGAVTSLSPDLALCRAYLVATLSPVIVAALFDGGMPGLGTAAVATLFIAFLLVQAGDLARDYGTALDNVALLAARAEAREAAIARAAEAEAAAHAASQAKSDFLANISHEVRTPMTAIIGFAELLLARDLAGAERILHAETIRKNGVHLLAILNDVLDLSKIEAGKMSVAIEQGSPRDALADVASLMGARARERGLDFEVRLDTPIPRSMPTDPTRLRQILLNLVGNAIKFTKLGSVSVRARLRDEAGSRALIVDVVDTGTGISAEEAGRLFQPFTQLESSASRAHEGTGLGLHISRRFAQMLGGDIRVASTPGAGSTFTVELPIPSGEIDLVDSLRLERPSRPEAIAPGALHGLRVLLAEDGVDNQRLVTAILIRAGATVVDVVGDGLAAVNKASIAMDEGRAYHVVLMDMQMPVVDGYGATARLRETGYKGAIVALTAHAMTSNLERCMLSGCDAYLSKPIQTARMIDALTRYLPRPTRGHAERVAPAISAAPPANDHHPVPSAAFDDDDDGPLESRLHDDPEIADLVDDFLVSLEAYVESLRTSVAAQDHARTAQIAHLLAGSGGTFGFDAITTVARRLELACITSDSAGYARETEGLLRLCDRAIRTQQSRLHARLAASS